MDGSGNGAGDDYFASFRHGSSILSLSKDKSWGREVAASAPPASDIPAIFVISVSISLLTSNP
jgi:hypothetical protein